VINTFQKAKPQHSVFGVFNAKFLACLVVDIQNCALYFITVISAGIVLRKFLHGLLR